MSIDRVNDTTDGTQMLRLSEQTREFSEQTSLTICNTNLLAHLAAMRAA